MGKVHDAANEVLRDARDNLGIGEDDVVLEDWRNADPDDYMIARLIVSLEDTCGSYDGAMEDCDGAVEVLIRRIKGDADLESAAEWVRLNYPTLARKHGLIAGATP